jgi:hypothetical protein
LEIWPARSRTLAWTCSSLISTDSMSSSYTPA